MANETVLFKRGDSATITSTPVTDGQILFDTSGNGKMYLDNGADRLEMGGAITVDASLSKTSTNAIQNKAVTGNILNSLAEVSAATQQNTIAGALALKEVNSSLTQFSIEDTSLPNGTTLGEFCTMLAQRFYKSKEYLWNNGFVSGINWSPSFAGGYSNSSNYSSDNGLLYAKCSAGSTSIYANVCWASDAIDVTDYNYLVFKGTFNCNTNVDGGLCTSIGSINNTPALNSSVKTNVITNGTYYELKVDISDISGTYHAYIGARNGTSSVSVTQCYLTDQYESL